MNYIHFSCMLVFTLSTTDLFTNYSEPLSLLKVGIFLQAMLNGHKRRYHSDSNKPHKRKHYAEYDSMKCGVFLRFNVTTNFSSDQQ